MDQTPDAGQNIITRGLPKTGQVLVYNLGDDETYQAGWWKGRLNANNRTRFIAKTIEGDDIVLDRATGLMWAADGNAAGCNNGVSINWLNALTYANILNFAGFSDWRLPNLFELESIRNMGKMNPAIDEPPFANTATGSCWSSTSDRSLSTRAWRVATGTGVIYTTAKTTEYHMRCVRKGI